MYCIHCGEQVVASAKFCAACGEKVQRPQDEEQRSDPTVPVLPALGDSEASADPAIDEKTSLSDSEGQRSGEPVAKPIWVSSTTHPSDSSGTGRKKSDLWEWTEWLDAGALRSQGVIRAEVERRSTQDENPRHEPPTPELPVSEDAGSSIDPAIDVETPPSRSQAQGADKSAVEPARPTYHSSAGFWRRLVALIIDYVILFPLLLVVAFISILVEGSAGIFYELASAATVLLYFARMESSARQATPGKLVLGIKVVTLSGDRVSFARASGRNIAKVLNLLTLGVGWFMAGFTERRQGLHDIVSECLVVKK